MSGIQLIRIVLCPPILFCVLIGIRLEKERFIVRFVVRFCEEILIGILVIILIWVMDFNVQVDIDIIDFYISLGMTIPYLYDSFRLSSFGLLAFMVFKV